MRVAIGFFVFDVVISITNLVLYAAGHHWWSLATGVFCACMALVQLAFVRALRGS